MSLASLLQDARELIRLGWCDLGEPPTVFPDAPCHVMDIEALYLDIGWLDFPRRDMLVASLEFGHPVLRVAPPHELSVGGEEQGSNFMDETHCGVHLWSICEYELCVKFDCSRSDLLRRPNLADDVAETFSRARALVEWSTAVITHFRPRTAIYPQGYIVEAAAFRAVAKLNNLRCLAVENTFRSDRFCWDDERGVTLASAIPMRLFNETAQPKDSSSYFERYRSDAAQLKSGEHSNLTSDTPAESELRKILFIGQVNTDSSVLFHIGEGFPDQMSAVETLAQFVAEHADDTLLLKVHPKEVRGVTPQQKRYSLKRYDDFASKFASEENGRIAVDRDAQFDIMKAIEWADLCVTINSQAGLEAAALGKPVIVCGDANYGALRSVRNVETPTELSEALTRESETDVSEAQHFFEEYCERYCRPKNLPSLIQLAASGRDARAGVSRIFILLIRVLIFGQRAVRWIKVRLGRILKQSGSRTSQ